MTYGYTNYTGPLVKEGDKITLTVTGTVEEVTYDGGGIDLSPEILLRTGNGQPVEFDLGSFDEVIIHPPSPEPGDAWRGANGRYRPSSMLQQHRTGEWTP